MSPLPFSSRGHLGQKARGQRTLLFLQGLEQRIAPANLLVTDGGDNGGAGQLRAAWETSRTNGQADTITVDAGVTSITLTAALTTYDEAQNLAIIGNGKNVTVIVAAPGQRIFNFKVPSAQPTISISDLTLQGGTSSGNGGAILDDNEALTLTNVAFTHNSAASGGSLAVAAATTTLIITGCDFTTNTSSGTGATGAGGGAIFIGAAATVTINSSQFDGNRTNVGGSSLSVVSSTFKLNSDSSTFVNGVTTGTGSTSGGAFFMAGGAQTVTIDHGTITGNTTGNGGGGLYAYNSSVSITINNSSISNNHCTTGGGALAAWSGTTISLTNDTLSYNTATNQAGGAIWTNGVLSVTSSVLSGNWANSSTIGAGGGAIYSNNTGATMSIAGCTFTNNTASGTSGFGGAIRVRSNLTVTSTTFTGNTAAAQGGAIYEIGLTTVTYSSFSSNTANSVGGGAIRGLNGVTVNNSSFTSNTALGTSGGGAIYATSVNGSNDTFSYNRASAGPGGAVRVTSSSTLTLSSVVSNTSSSTGGAVQAAGLSVSSCTFSGNSAASSGGAINGSPSGTSCTFSGNTAGGAGGAIFGGATNLSKSIFVNNLASGGGGALQGSATITYSVLRNNRSTNSSGGAMFGQGTIDASDFDQNTAAGNGGAVSGNGATWGISNSTFRNNMAGGDGGGLYCTTIIGFGSNFIGQSTFTGNRAAGAHGGGGIALSDTAALFLRNSSVFDNVATGSAASASGGGVSRNSSGTLYLSSTLVAANSVTGGGTGGRDIFSTTTISIAGNNNLIGSNDQSNITLTGACQAGTNVNSIDPMIAGLANNGGFVLPDGNVIRTAGLLPGSPAIGTGNDTPNFAYDQRDIGFPRTTGGLTDVGAFQGLTTRPSARLIAANVASAGTSAYSFDVIYDDAANLDSTTFDVSDVVVNGPGYGSGQSPTSISVLGSGAHYVVTYTIPAPTGGWGFTNVGNYGIAINPAQVGDGTYTVDAGRLGAFRTGFAENLIVDNTGDSTGNFGPGQMSFREAVRLANLNTGSLNSVTFDPSVFNSSQSIALVNGPQTIVNPLVINGPSAALTLSGGGGNARITLSDGVAVTITNLKFSDFTAATGGAVFSLGLASISLNNIAFSKNAATGASSGGAIAAAITASIIITNSSFSQNVAGNTASGSGGALSVTGTNSTVTIDSCTFDANTATTSGGAISVSSGTLVINKSAFTNNSAGASGALSAPSAAIISNDTFSMNTASSGSGGAISGSNVSVTNSQFVANMALGAATTIVGGALFVSGTPSVALCTFTNNVTSGKGGAIGTAASTSLTVQSSIFSGNTANGAGGGGAIYSASSLNVSKAIFTANRSAAAGGAIRGVSGSTISFADFNANVAAGGGGAVHAAGGTWQVNNSTLRGNVANGSGGALLVDATVTINQSSWAKNAAAGSGGGGAIAQNNGSLLINNSTIYDNSATAAASGGGLVRLGTGSLVLNSTIIAGNKITGPSNLGMDLYSSFSVTLAGNTNLIGSNDASNVTFTATGGAAQLGTNAAPIDPLLLDLADNGGVVLPDGSVLQTLALKAGSPAIGKGNNTAGFSNDQRDVGFIRVINPALPDVGAYQFDTTSPASYLSALPDVAAAGNATYAFQIRYLDNVAFDPTSLDLNDVTITGPGFSGQHPIAVDSVGSGASVTATYTIPAPAGGWGALNPGNTFNIGNYTISVNANEVRDAESPPHYGYAGVLGTFKTGFGRAFVVDTPTDVDDGDVSAMHLSLREALRISDLNAGFVDSITFDPTVFGGVTINVNSTLNISDSAIITGPGRAKLTLSGQDANRILNINIPNSGFVTLAAMALTHGRSASGGAILCNTSSLTLTDVDFSANSATNSSGAGGAISTNGAITLSNCILQGNSAGVTGAGSALISGGGIYAYGALKATLCVFKNNFAYGGGGAIYDDSSITLDRCQFTNNSTKGRGSAIYSDDGVLTISNTTFSNNTGTGVIGSWYGYAQANITNSTFFGNLGGVIDLAQGLSNVLNLNDCTIVNNTAFAGNSNPGAIFHTSGGSFDMLSSNSIIAANAGYDGLQSQYIAWDIGGYSVTGNNNLIGAMYGASGTDWVVVGTGNIVGTTNSPVNPQVNGLANNGGFVLPDGTVIQTVSLKSNSPALNKGGNPLTLATDQRGTGYDRVSGLQADMGAVEFQYPPKVTSITFGDGTAQRSMVKQIVVTFNTAVNFMGGAAAAFTLHRSGTGGTTGDVILTGNPASGPTSSVTLTFSGSLTENGSLVDGIYNLIVGAAQVSGAGGALDGNNDTIPGGDYTVTGTTANKFFRFYGDQNGDAAVDQNDYLIFRNALSGGPSTVFDFNNDGDVDQNDYLRFRQNISGSP
ncbi:MAG: choice-of-anchor Q domain-containing protein [Gemmataceae bacterium]